MTFLSWDSNPRQSVVKLHQTGIFDGLSTNWATALRLARYFVFCPVVRVSLDRLSRTRSRCTSASQREWKKYLLSKVSSDIFFMPWRNFFVQFSFRTIRDARRCRGCLLKLRLKSLRRNILTVDLAGDPCGASPISTYKCSYSVTTPNY